MWSVTDAVWREEVTPEPGTVNWVSRVKKHTGMSAANQRGRASTLARRKREKEAARQTWFDRLLVDTFADIREIERGGYGLSN